MVMTNAHLNPTDHSISLHVESEHGGKYAPFIKSIIYGGVDGVITTFAIITASYAADLSIKTILILGLSNVLADGFSMGFGDYASSFSEREHYLSERKKEVHEYDYNISNEIIELIDMYVEKGMNVQDSNELVYLLSKPENKEIFISHMMMMEFNLCEPDSNHEIMKHAVSTVMSFYIFGFVPLFTYIFAKMVSFQNKHFIFVYTCIVSGFVLFTIGAFSAYISKRSLLKGGLITFTNGSIASATAYLIGYSLNKILS